MADQLPSDLKILMPSVFLLTEGQRSDIEAFGLAAYLHGVSDGMKRMDEIYNPPPQPDIPGPECKESEIGQQSEELGR